MPTTIDYMISNLDRKPIRDIISELNAVQQEIFIKFVIEKFEDSMSSSNFKSAKLVKDLLTNNSVNSYNDLLDKFNDYKLCTNQYEKVVIRYGERSAIELKEKYNKRPKPSSITCLSTTFWTNKGFSVEEAKRKVFVLQSANAKKKHNRFKENNLSYKEILPNCIEYWLKRGYAETEGEILRKLQSSKSEMSYENYISKFGLEAGTLKLKDITERRKATLIERYGTYAFTGACSKESLRFFIPLYKTIRKLGVHKDDIFWGIKGSKEFAQHKDGFNFFYDFTIKSLKITIEYNGVFWHARPNDEWKGFGIKEENLAYNLIKSNAITDFGYEQHIVWSDENLKERRNELIEIIKEKYDNATS